MMRTISVRLLMSIPVLFGVTLLVFLVMRLVPGDPALVMFGPSADAGQVQQLQLGLGLDRPWPIQYVIWLGQILSGDLGRSLSLSQPVADAVVVALGPTLLLVGSALLVGGLVGVLVGLVAARYQCSAGDRVLRLLALLGISTPFLLLGLLSVLVFAVWLGLFPVSGMLSAFGDGGAMDLLSHLLLPMASLALVTSAIIARGSRDAVLDALQQAPIAMARARGIGEQRIFRSHVLRRVVTGVVPVFGSQIGFVICGAVYIETIFQWPGLGRLLVDAVAVRDIPLVQGGVLILAVITILVTLLADLIRLWLAPRAREL